MELNAVKGILKDMGIKYEKFHTRNAKVNPFAEKKSYKSAPKKFNNTKDKPSKNSDL